MLLPKNRAISLVKAYISIVMIIKLDDSKLLLLRFNCCTNLVVIASCCAFFCRQTFLLLVCTIVHNNINHALPQNGL